MQDIIFNPNVNYLFAFEVSYAQHSMTGSALEFTNAQDAQKAAVVEAIRLAGFGYEIERVQVHAVCKDCDGRGEIMVFKSKRASHRTPKRCPVCKGKQSTVVVI